MKWTMGVYEPAAYAHGVSSSRLSHLRAKRGLRRYADQRRRVAGSSGGCIQGALAAETVAPLRSDGRERQPDALPTHLLEDSKEQGLQRALQARYSDQWTGLKESRTKLVQCGTRTWDTFEHEQGRRRLKDVIAQQLIVRLAEGDFESLDQ